MTKRRTDGGYMAAPAYKKPQPTFTLDEKDLPEIKEWKVGEKYALVLEVEMVSASKGDEYMLGSDESKKHSARFKIISVANEGAEEQADETK